MTRLARPAVAAVLVLGFALMLVVPAQRVWTTAWIPAANRVHYGDGLVVALTLAGFALYLLTSVLFVRRRPISPAALRSRSEGCGDVKPAGAGGGRCLPPLVSPPAAIIRLPHGQQSRAAHPRLAVREH